MFTHLSLIAAELRRVHLRRVKAGHCLLKYSSTFHPPSPTLQSSFSSPQLKPFDISALPPVSLLPSLSPPPAFCPPVLLISPVLPLFSRLLFLLHLSRCSFSIASPPLHRCLTHLLPLFVSNATRLLDPISLGFVTGSPCVFQIPTFAGDVRRTARGATAPTSAQNVNLG